MSQKETVSAPVIPISGDDGNKRPKPKPVKTKPSRFLPTDRVTLPKQLDLLRAYVAASGPTGKVVRISDVANVIKLNTSTISMINPFLSDIKLIIRQEGGGYLPAAEVINYAKAHEWQPDIASHKLAPILGAAWFAQELSGKLSFRAVEETEALSDLAAAVNAGTEYKDNLRMLLDYMEAAGLIRREGTQIKAAKPITQASASAQPQKHAAHATGHTQPEKHAASSPPEQREVPPARAAVATSFVQPTQGVVQFHVSVKVDMTEFAGWSPERITSFFGGIAQVLAAKGAIEREASRE